ncbi:MAG: 50S ribosomal protein L32 [Rickettsiales bacterium]|jgi:large subunit ribosomal protein L32|nr:50S ribosomal protein L32 [Rickettsiales bacterium]
MAVPKKKTSQSKKNMRRSHHALGSNAASVCKNCGEPVAPHNICKACGSYGGRKVLETSSAAE